jgi:hypothetical protein
VGGVCDGLIVLLLLQLFDSETAEPLNDTVCGEPVALSVTFSVAAKVPVVVGLNVTVIWQVFPVESAVVQLLEVTAKLLALAPEIVVPLMVSAVLPVLVTVRVIGAIDPGRI